MREYMEHRALHGDTSVLPTPTFFYGLRVGEEAWIDIEPGKTLIVKLLSIGDVEPDGARVLTFEINGQSRQMRVADDAAKVTGPKRRRATADKPGEVGAPMPGRVIDLVTKVGEHVKAGQKLLVTEAMKLETVIKAPIDGHRARDRRGRGRERRGGRPAGRDRRRSARREAVSFRRARRGAARACCCPTARASTPRASASDWNEAFFAQGRTGSRALARWVASRRAARRRACPPARASASAVARPSKLVCIGLNYRDHARESGAALPGRADRLPEGVQRAGGAGRRSAPARAAARRPTGRSSWRW